VSMAAERGHQSESKRQKKAWSVEDAPCLDAKHQETPHEGAPCLDAKHQGTPQPGVLADITNTSVDVFSKYSKTKKRRGQSPERKREKERLANSQTREAAQTAKDGPGGYVVRPSVLAKRKANHTMCCDCGCSRDYSDAAATVRRRCRQLSTNDKRRFLKARIVHWEGRKENALDTHQYARVNTYFLESPARIESGVRLTVEGDRETYRQVCQEYFYYICNTSSDQVHQPEIADREFTLEYRGGQKSKRPANKPHVLQKVAVWLIAVAAAYEQDPTCGFVYLPFASRQVVHTQYMIDSRNPGEHGDVFEIGTASPSWFNKAWRNRCPHIKIRKVCVFGRAGGGGGGSSN